MTPSMWWKIGPRIHVAFEYEVAIRLMWIHTAKIFTHFVFMLSNVPDSNRIDKQVQDKLCCL